MNRVLYIMQGPTLKILIPASILKKPTKSVARPVLAQPIFFFVLRDVYRRLVWLHPAREPVPLVGTISSRHPRRPRRHLFTALDRARLLVAQLVLVGAPVAVLTLQRERVVAVPRPLPETSAAFGRALAPSAPRAPARFFYDGWWNCKCKMFGLGDFYDKKYSFKQQQKNRLQQFKHGLFFRFGIGDSKLSSSRIRLP